MPSNSLVHFDLMKIVTMYYERKGGEMPDRIKRISAERECCENRTYNALLPCGNMHRSRKPAASVALSYMALISTFSGEERSMLPECREFFRLCHSRRS